MVDEKVVELVLKLHKGTKDKKVTWTGHPYGDDVFEASFPRHSVRIEKALLDNSLDIVVTIMNDQGADVERFADTDLSKDFPGRAPGGTWFGFMSEIYDMARRQALRADEAIDAILEELQ